MGNTGVVEGIHLKVPNPAGFQHTNYKKVL